MLRCDFIEVDISNRIRRIIANVLLRDIYLNFKATTLKNYYLRNGESDHKNVSYDFYRI